MQRDFGGTALVSSLLALHKPRTLLNFAADSNVNRSIHGPGEFTHTNIVGTFNLLECLRASYPTYKLPVLTTNCRANCRDLEAGRVGEAYNISGWNNKPNLDYVRTMCAPLDKLKPRTDGKACKEQITYVTARPGHDRRYNIDARKIEQELTWKPADTFDTGSRKTVQWYLDHPDSVAKQYSAGALA